VTTVDLVIGEVVLLALIAVASIFLERRYRGRRNAARGSWQRTQERFIDPSTGELTEVWYDPQTGERDYRPAGKPQQ